jgi:hypothetical protein
MKWVVIGLGGVIAVAVAVIVIGMLLPSDHIASRRARFQVPPETLFGIVSDFGGGAAWRPVKRVEILPARDGKPSFREVGEHGGLTYVIEELTAPTRIVTRIVDNPAFGGTWTYELESDGAGSVLVITERGEVYNPFFRFMGRFFFSQTATMEGYLAALGKKLGENVQPEP